MLALSWTLAAVGLRMAVTEPPPWFSSDICEFLLLGYTSLYHFGSAAEGEVEMAKIAPTKN